MKPSSQIVPLVLALLSLEVARAQVPQLISYQGRLLSGGTNLSGPGQFKFALVNSNGAPSYWSNNGSSVNGSEPTAAVTVVVAGVVTGAKLAAGAVTSASLADTVALGATNAFGRLDIYRTAANTPAISLLGSSSQISTYGSDGLEQV